MKKLYSLVLLLGLVLFVSTFPVQAAMLSFDPAAQTINVGDTASVDLNITLSSTEPNLAAFDLFVGFDPSILSFSSATFGDQLNQGNPLNSLQLVSPGIIDVELWEVSYLLDLSGQLDQFVLATLDFMGIDDGTSPLTVTGDLTDDSIDVNLIAYQSESGSITVERVPEPGTIFLVGVGLAGVWAVRRKRAS